MTIYALSSGPGISGIAVVRISGQETSKAIKLLTGKNPPEDIRVKAKFNESNDLTEKMFKIINIRSVNVEYKKNILIACFKISLLLKEI